MKVDVSDQKLVNFQPKMEASACYLEVDNQILLIQQEKGGTDEGQWGVPAGKLELNETPEMAAKRELFEETGIQLLSPAQIIYLTTLYIRKPDLDYIYYMFRVPLNKKPSIKLSVEHSDYRWVSRDDLRKLPLRPGVKEALQYYRKILVKAAFTFRFFQKSDEQMVSDWLHQDYIAEWIHGVGLQNTLNGLTKFSQGQTDTIYWIGYHEHTPFAFLITSPEGEDAITLDLFICDPKYLGKGLAVPMIKEFLISQFPHVKRVLIDPEATNSRAIYVYEKVGFKIIGEFIASWHPVPHFQMELNMKDILPRKERDEN